MMWGRLFTFTSAASLLVCAGLLALWIRGFFAIDQWNYTIYEGKGGVVWTLISGRGGLAMARSRIASDPTTSGSPSNIPRPSWMHRAGRPRYPEWGTPDGTMLHIESYGFEYLYQHITLGGIGRADVSFICRAVSFPIWCPAAITAVLPIAWAGIWFRRRAQSRPRHACRCGYDLTGNTSGVCPECGKAVRVHQ